MVYIIGQSLKNGIYPVVLHKGNAKKSLKSVKAVAD